LAALLGVDLRQAEGRQLALAGRPQLVRCRYAPVRLRISDGSQETYEWTAVIGFVAVRLHYNLLGHAGFLQYFDAEFRGVDREVVLTGIRRGSPPFQGWEESPPPAVGIRTNVSPSE
jgi:hypothetical protein